jgi:putative transposase
MPRAPRRETTRANERWAVDFMQDVLADGRTVRVFALVDAHTRERLALEGHHDSAVPRWRRA